MAWKVFAVAVVLGRLWICPSDAWSVFRRGRPMVVTFPFESDVQSIHEHFMRLALEEAKQAAKRNEVPIGALVVENVTKVGPSTTQNKQKQHTFRILSSGRNMVEAKFDASAHAELIVLRQAAQRLQNWRLINCTLYSTLEPCPMCLSACQAFRLSRLVFGAPDLRLGAVETHMRLLDIVHPFHNVSVEEMGVLRDDCSDIIRSFFRERRGKNDLSTQEPRSFLVKTIFRLWSRLKVLIPR
eukprot:scaffold43532_cov191-Amphora_coffeaeformis.AAC.2